MISNAEAMNTFELKDYYVILPNTRFNNINKIFKKKFNSYKNVSKDFSYNSKKNKFLSIQELQKIIQINRSDLYNQDDILR